MDTKEQVLALFESSKGTYFSGEDIARKLGISRTAVWKCVKSLCAEGYPITAIRNRGYCLSAQADVLCVPGVQKYLSPLCGRLQLQMLPVLPSTNAYAREKAADGAPDGCVFIAAEQTNGRGRSAHTFFSPADSGIYMSILLRPEHCPPRHAVRLTTLAAAAVCEAIEDVSGQEARIKWVNDIYIGKKKVCGILTEASFGLEDGFLEYAVVGIGVNVFPPANGFPEDIRDIAGCVFPASQSDGKNRLAAAILNRFMEHYRNLASGDYTHSYRKHSLVIGKEIEIVTPERIRRAVALDIDQDCRLLVRYEDGEEDALYSGQISIRVINTKGV